MYTQTKTQSVSWHINDREESKTEEVRPIFKNYPDLISTWTDKENYLGLDMTPKTQGTIGVGDSGGICHSTENKEYLF